MHIRIFRMKSLCYSFMKRHTQTHMFCYYRKAYAFKEMKNFRKKKKKKEAFLYVIKKNF